MNQEEFKSKLSQAATYHNTALTHKRKASSSSYGSSSFGTGGGAGSCSTSTSNGHANNNLVGPLNAVSIQAYETSIESYEKALELYTECHDYYNLLLIHEECGAGSDGDSDDRDYINAYSDEDDGRYQNKYPKNAPATSVTINLELKISQTLQSIAKLHMILSQDVPAIKAHEDTITLLLEGKDRKHASSPRSVASTNMFQEPTRKRPSGSCSITSQYKIVTLTPHERTRIISSSLTSLAQIYLKRESQYNGIGPGPEQYNLEEEEDALHYFTNGLNFLTGLGMGIGEHASAGASTSESFDGENPEAEESQNHGFVSRTNIQSLSNERQSAFAFVDNDMNECTDEAVYNRANDGGSSQELGAGQDQTYVIDLRKDVLSILLQIAALHKKRRNFHDAITVYEQARDMRLLLHTQSSQGGKSGSRDDGWDPKEEEMIESMLALSYERAQRYTEAHSCYKHVLKLRKGLFGDESVQVANLYASMSNLQRKTGDLGQSLGWNKRAIVIYSSICAKNANEEKKVGKNGTMDASWKPDVRRHLIGSMQNQGALYVQMKEINQAIAAYLSVCEKQVQFQGEEHPDVARTLNVLGDLYMSINEMSEARASFDRALKLYRKYDMGHDDPDMVGTLQSLCQIEVQTKGELIQEKESRSRRNTTHKEKALISPPPKVQRHRHKNEKKSRHSKPKSRPGKSRSPKLIDNKYRKVIETKSFEDDDAVSQITFVTNQPEITNKATRTIAEHTYKTIESNLDNWSPAEYVFRAVDKIASATEEFFTFQTPKFTEKKKDSSPGSPHKARRKGLDKHTPVDDEMLGGEEGYEVREFMSKTESLVLTKSIRPDDLKVQHRKNADEGNEALAVKPPEKIQSSGDIDSSQRSALVGTQATVVEKMSTASYDNASVTSDSQHRTRSLMDMDESVATSAFGSLAGTKFLSDADSTVVGTDVSSMLGSLAGTKFLSDAESTVGEMQHLSQRTLNGPDLVASTLGIEGKAPTQKEKSFVVPDTELQLVTAEPLKKSSSKIDMDAMLAQMNVVTCDMEGDAMPFEEVLISEGVDSVKEKRSSLTKKDKTFEKLSACLDNLIELKEKYGPEHGKVLQNMATLASLYLENGNDSKGIKKYYEVLELQNRKFGRNSTQVAETHVKMGQHWTKKGEIDKALDSFSKAKEIDLYLYGKTHPQIAQHLNRMGMAELDRNEFDIAMDYMQEALKIQKSHLAPNETNADVSQTLVNMGAVYYKERNCLEKIRSNRNTYKSFIESGMLGNIAFAHSERGEYIMAMHFYDEVLELFRNKENPNNFGITATHNSLGELNLKAGRFTEAMEHHKEALRIVKSMHVNELELSKTNCNIGVVEYHLGHFKKANTILENVCSIQRGILGNAHSRVAKTMYHLSVIKRVQFDLDRAMQLLNEGLRIQLSTIGQYSPDTINTQIEISKVLLDMNDFEGAISQLQRVFKNQTDVLGPDHPDLARTLQYVGICYSRKGDESKAMKYFERCHRLQSKLINFDCPIVASTMDELGRVLLKQGKLEKAFHVLTDSLRVRREVGEDHYTVAFSLYSLGGYYTAKRNYPESLRCFKDSMRIAVLAFGLEHPFIGDIHVGVGNVNTRKCQFDEAKSEFKKALKIYHKCNVPEAHSRVTKCQKDLKRVEHEEALCV